MAARYRLVLEWTEPVDRAEVEHIAEDCTRNGDHPADEYSIELLDDEDPDDGEDEDVDEYSIELLDDEDPDDGEDEDVDE